MSYTFVLNGTLIDGLGDPPLPNAGVLIEDDRIVAAGRREDLRLPDADVTLLDVEQGTILRA